MSVSAYPYATAKAKSGLTVSPQANGDTNTNAGTCYVGVQFNSNGTEYERNASSGAYNVSQGAWLDAGTAAEVWVAFTRTGGVASFVGMTNGTRYNLGTTRSFGITDGGGSSTITGYFTFYDAASGGNVLATTGSASWTAVDTTA